MSTTTKQVLIIVKQQGLDQVTTSLKGLDATSKTTTKSTNGLGSAWDKQKSSTLNLRTGVANLDNSEKKVVKTTGTLAKETDKAAKSTSGLAAKFQGNKGLIFSTVGIFTAGMEAVGMYQQLTNAQAKEAEAQDRLNKLQNAGVTSGQLLEQAERDVADAKRGVAFAGRIMALSFGDLIPFSLLLFNSMFKLKETLGGVKAAADTASAGATTLGNAARTASTGGLANIATSAGTATTGLTNFGNASRLSNTSLGNLITTTTNYERGLVTTNTRVLDATRLIGNNNSGLTGGYYGLSTGIDNSTKMSTKFRDVFTRIGQEIKNLPNTFKSIGTSIASFFTNFGTHIGKLPGLFQKAGTAVIGFGRAITVALLSNPITAILAGISAAVLALASDFGGVRTAINNAGIAIGNAVPQAKGLLQSIGDLVNGGLDWIANQLGIKKSTEDVNKASSDAASQGLAELKQALVIPLATSTNFDKLRQGIEKFTETSINSKTAVVGLSTWMTNLHNSLTPNQKTIPGVSTVLGELTQIEKDAANGTITLTEAKNKVGAALTKLQLIITKEEMAQQKSIQATDKNTDSTQKRQNATLGLREDVVALSSAVMQEAAAGKTSGTQMDKNIQIAKEYAQQHGIAVAEIDKLTQADNALLGSLIDIAPALELIGDNLVHTNQNSIDWTKTLQNMINEQKNMEATAKQTWTQLKEIIDKNGVEGLRAVDQYIKIVEASDKQLGAQLRKTFDEYSNDLQEAGLHVEYLGEKEKERAEENQTWQQKEVKALLDKRKELNEQAKALGIYNDISTQSNKTMEVAITHIQEERAKRDELIRSMQTLALERGMEEQDLTVNIGKLKEYVETHGLAPPTLKEVQVASTKLTAARQEDQRAAELERQAAEDFIQTLGIQANVSGLSAKGLLNVADAYDTIQNASTIAADSVSDWLVGLDKARAVEEAEIKVLEDYARMHQIEIPKSIQGDIEKTKEYIEVVKGVGPAAKKAAQEAKKAFTDMANEASDAIADLIKEDVLAGKAKNVEKILDDLGLKAKDLGAIRPIIEIAANTVDFEDKIASIPELVISMLKGIPPQTTAQADAIVNTFASEMESEFGNRIPGIGNTINSLWSYVKTEYPQKSAAEQVEIFRNEIMKDPALFAKAAQMGIVDPVTGQVTQGFGALPGIGGQYTDDLAQTIFGQGAHFSGAGNHIAEQTTSGYKSGIHTFPTEGKKAMYELLKMYDPAKAEAYAKANAIAESTTEGISTMQKTVPTEGQIAMHKLMQSYDPIGAEAYAKAKGIATQTGQGLASGAGDVASGAQTGIRDPVIQNIELIPNEAETAVAPVEGVFSQAFLDASNAATGQLEGLFVKVRTGMGTMTTQITFQLGTMKTAWETHGAELNTIVGTMDQKVLTFVTNMATNATNIGTHTGTMGTAFNTLWTTINTTMGQADQKLKTFVSNSQTSFNSFQGATNIGITAITAFWNGLNRALGQADQKLKTFTSNSKTSFDTVKTATGVGSKAIGDFWSKWNDALGRADQKVKTFASNTGKAFKDVGKEAAAAAQKVKQLQKAIDSLKSKRINIYVGLTGPGARFYRHGGSFLSMEPTGFAQSGAAFINTKPRKIGGMNISEFGKPELVTVTPLSDPGNPMDKTIQGMSVPKPQAIPHKGGLGGLIGSGGIGGNGGQPITVTGNMNISVVLPNGQVLAKEVQKYLLEGFSGIT